MTSAGVPADGGHAQAMRNLQRVNNKNNIQELYLRRRLASMDRVQAHSIALIDKVRYDQYDFLKQIRRCESDELPEFIRYFGKDKKARKNAKRDMKTPSSPTRLPTATPIYTGNDKANKTDDARNTNNNNSNNSDLPVIQLRDDRRLLSTAPAHHNRLGPPPERMQDKRDIVTAPGKTRVGWAEKPEDSLAKLSLDDNKKVDQKDKRPEQKDANQNQLIGYDQSRYLPPIIEVASPQNPDPVQELKDVPAPANYSSGKFGNEEIMKEVLTMKVKSHKKRKRKRPMEDRLQSFYKKIEEIKVERTEMPPIWQDREQWAVLTRGISLPVNDSSDESD